LALRLAQINFLEEKYHDKPILLLDDIFSELDLEHQQLVVKICQNYQTIFTSSEPDDIKILSQAKVIQL
jgi:DNA replication and repair protein RecF